MGSSLLQCIQAALAWQAMLKVPSHITCSNCISSSLHVCWRAWVREKRKERQTVRDRCGGLHFSCIEKAPNQGQHAGERGGSLDAACWQVPWVLPAQPALLHSPGPCLPAMTTQNTVPSESVEAL